ncbi:glycosyltransferase family A protein [Stenotrophomonas sp.]|uniref:glycosyltransferase family 2 protein n=1 Tax=Stenotrophomonas sp. TaxID=69392 RepID=UPI00289F708F|nr:glycosyltransferase family A protein [Stenotrophomonas sp.]
MQAELGRVPRVSVVIPAYNNGRDIAATVRSILAQDYLDFELVIADHSSGDDTAAVIASFADDPRVRVLEPTPAGGGAQANWNRVSQHARGELIKLVCGDDLLAPQALRMQVAAFDANPSAVFVASRRDLVDAGGKQLLKARGLAGLSGCIPGREAALASILAGTNIFGEPCCVMLRRDALEQAGWWDARFPYLIDQASYSNVMIQGDMVALPEVLASFRISASQWSVRLMRQQSEQAIAFHESFAREHPGLATSAQLRRGNLKARVMAWARRLAYMWLRRRM